MIDKIKLEELATKFITLGEHIRNVYGKPDNDDADAEELQELTSVHAAAFDLVEGARARKGKPVP